MATSGSDDVLAKLFGDTAVSSEQLSAAVEQAQVGSLRFWRLWWKGQPHLELIRGGLTVQPAELTNTVSELLRLHNSLNQISFEVFPKGVVQLDAVDVHVEVNRNIRG